jgi:2-succinyl-6-hydroxy-2,4-cyclohexadiene-1-carboxylate synthase
MTEHLSVNGVDLAWDEWGEGPGPALVLCHGYTGSALDFSLQVEGLSAARRVVTLDQRGHGRTTKTGTLAGYTIDQLVDDLVSFAEKAGGGPVDLLGHSMGGLVSLGAVLSRPDLFHSLILMDTSAWSFLPEDEGVRTMVGDYMAKFDPARGVPSVFGLEGPEQALIEATAPSELLRAREASFAGMDAYAIKALGTALLAEGFGSLRPRLPGVTCPVTVLVGARDHPLVDQAPALAAEVAHGHLTVIDGAYHSPQLTHPDEWRHAVEQHLAHAGD